jgi:hypothetical protein
MSNVQAAKTILIRTAHNLTFMQLGGLIMHKPIRLIIMRTTVLTCVLLFSAGCGSVNKDAASKLADQGALVAKTIGQSYQSTDQDIARYVEGEFLLSGLKPGYSPPSDAMLKSIDTVEEELRLRQQMLAGLGDVYTSFGALCTYDAKGEIEKSLGNTVQAGNSLAALLGGGAISDSAGKLFAMAGGDVAGQVQFARIKDASAKIRSLLQGIVFLLQKTNEQAVVVAVREEITRGKLKVAREFWTGDFALADGILDEQIQAYGLTPNASALSYASQNPGLRDGVSAVLAWRQKQEEDSQVAAYNAAIQSLRTLINEHAKIEAGEPVNLVAIQSYMATVQQYVDLITAVKKGK